MKLPAFLFKSGDLTIATMAQRYLEQPTAVDEGVASTSTSQTPISQLTR